MISSGRLGQHIKIYWSQKNKRVYLIIKKEKNPYLDLVITNNSFIATTAAAPAVNDMNAETTLVTNEPTAGNVNPTLPTIINATVANKNPITSFPVTFKKPTII